MSFKPTRMNQVKSILKDLSAGEPIKKTSRIYKISRNTIKKYWSIDDFGLQHLDQKGKLALLQMLEDRYGDKSTIIVSQLPIEHWHTFINEPTIADAILDRILA